MYVVIDNDFMVKGEHFYGIYKDLMFTLKGEMRNTLSIYSIPGKKKIYETAYSGPIEITKDSKLSFWLETSIARNSTLIILLCRRRIKPAMSSDGVGRW
ncbi:MAG: hypothetical protein HY805_04535 [Nitrospirae bacterium]|nr:hypothetical protein [Nitrospirota bacterium]